MIGNFRIINCTASWLFMEKIIRISRSMIFDSIWVCLKMDCTPKLWQCLKEHYFQTKSIWVLGECLSSQFVARHELGRKPKTWDLHSKSTRSQDIITTRIRMVVELWPKCIKILEEFYDVLVTE